MISRSECLEETRFRNMLAGQIYLYDPANHDSNTNAVISAATKRMRAQRDAYCGRYQIQTPPCVGVSDNLIIGARATKILDNSAIAINSGLIISLWNVANSIPRKGSICGDLQFAAGPDSLPRYHNNGSVISQSGSELEKRSAFWIWQAAVDFIFFHELTHLVNGHIDYDKATYDRKADASYSLERHNLDRQTFEFDADRTAAHMSCVLTAESDSVQIGQCLTQILLSAGRVYAEREHEAEKACLNVTHIVLVFLISDVKWSYAGLPTKCHQPPQLRLAQILPVILSYSQNEFSDTAKWLYYVSSVYHSLVNIFSVKFGYRPISSITAPEAMKPYEAEGFEYLDKILNNYAKLRPSLIKYSIGAGLAPANEY